MSEWQELCWGNLATLEYGKALRGYQNAVGPYQVYGTNGPIGWHTSSLYNRPSVIIGRKGAYRGVHYAPRPFYVINTAFYLKPKKIFDMRWAYYEFLTHDINTMDSGSAIPSTSREDFYQLPVLVPPLDEQHTIASVLSALDDKIDLNQRMNETLEAMARAIFKDWFVDFGPVRAKAEGHAPYFAPEIWELFPKALDDEDKPVGWMNSRLGDFVELVYGKALKADVRKLGSIPVYGSNGQVGWHNVNLADGPGVVVGRKGNPGTANYVIEDFFCIDTTFYTKPKSPHWTYSFLWLLIEHLDLPGLAADSAVPGLNREIAYSAECVVPKSEVAVAFSETVEPLLTRIAHNEKESETLAQLRNLLLPKLMSGEIRLREAEKAVEAVA